MSDLPSYIAEYIVAVRNAIRAIPTGGMKPYVTQVHFGLEGEDLPHRLVPDEFEDYDIKEVDL